jgi:hypothetical protein
LAVAGAVGAATVAWGNDARASRTYPSQIMSYLEKGDKGVPACPPTCLLCHTSPNGESETVRATGFVETLKAQGEVVMPIVIVGDDRPIERALASLESGPCAVTGMPGPCNTDGEGLDDMAEIRAGTDPQSTAVLSECPQYGCGAKAKPAAQAAAQSREGLPPVGAVASVAFLLAFRQLGRRRRR